MKFAPFILLHFLLILCLAPSLYSQSVDSVPASFIEKVRKLGQKETMNSIEKFRAGRITLQQGKLLQDIRMVTRKAKLYLDKGIDTTAYHQFIDNTRYQLSYVEEGLNNQHPATQTQRNLAVSAAILQELKSRSNTRRTALTNYLDNINDYIDQIDSLSADSALYTFPQDSANTQQYLRRITVLVKELGPTDTALRKSSIYSQDLLTEMDLLIFSINIRSEQVEKIQTEMGAGAMRQDLAFPWVSESASRSFKEVLRTSYRKELLALQFYLAERSGWLIFLALMVFGAWAFLRSLRKRLQEENKLQSNAVAYLVLKSPVLSALIITISVFQFVFTSAPFVFSFIIWWIAGIYMSIVFRHFISAFWWRFWMVLMMLFSLAGFFDLLLQHTDLERWSLLLLASFGALYGISVLRSSHKPELKESKILYFVGFLIFLEVLSVISNLAGRYNLSKTLMIVGFSGSVVAIELLWTIRLINETLAVISSIYKHPDRKLFYIDFDKVGDRVPGIFYVLATLGWFLLVSRHFYGLRKFSGPVSDFLNADRTLGSYSFSINSLLIFILIIGISTIVSQVISFFAGEPGEQRNKKRRPGLGSWLLLIRIFILSIGIFLAFAAAGIPLDKLTLLLGALGVGIGLGLQGLVSNLVSGLIIAFEKPVNVGDIIEVNGNLGTMQSIGFRSCVVKLIDGPSLIVPNSDLLSQHLVNWTMGHNHRRLNIVVSVAYGSNLAQVKAILEQVLSEHEKVLKNPEPLVAAKSFEDSSVDFDLYFWIAHIRETIPVKNDILSRVHDAFRANGITIPFPQTDLHIIQDQESSKR